MKSLTQYIFEWRQDTMPKLVVIIGGPGAGKTYWMTEHSIEKKDENGNVVKDKDGNVIKQKEISGFKQLFGTANVSKILDMDHNLEQVQKENAREIAKNLITGIKAGADEKWFKSFINAKQADMDAACEKGKSPKVNLSLVDFDFINELAKRYIEDETILGKLQEEFVKEYWKKIFASDFSRRAQSKDAYKKTYINKLKGILDNKEGEKMFNDENSNTSDVCLAICGDDIDKFYEIAQISGSKHALYVVYLDIPEEMSIEADKKRDRSVGEEMVRQKLKGVHETWELLKQQYEKIGIWTMYHLETPLGKFPKWKVTEKLYNKKMIGSQSSQLKK